MIDGGTRQGYTPLEEILGPQRVYSVGVTPIRIGQPAQEDNTENIVDKKSKVQEIAIQDKQIKSKVGDKTTKSRVEETIVPHDLSEKEITELGLLEAAEENVPRLCGGQPKTMFSTLKSLLWPPHC